MPRRRHDRRCEERPLRPAQIDLAKIVLAWALAFAAGAQPLKIVATTPELQSLAAAVGGDLVAVSHLVPVGQDAEAFQPRPQDLARVREARAVLRVGLDYDLWLDRLLREARGVAVIDASTDVALLDVRAGGIGPGDGHAHGRGNPHYWLDPVNAEMITATLLESFSRLDPANAKRYDANRRAFLAKLDAKLGQWSRALAKAPPLVAYHDTWPYFARRFRLRFVGIIESRPGVAPSPAHLATLIETAKKERVGIVVREAHESQRDAEFIASRSGAKVVTLSSHGDDYLSLIDDDVRRLTQ
ncbi:MAG TPA: metal ABC transporter substrate-binding protein [Usitatibacter sp.]|nr:metal ABC transporter substrate-binding protein [Usitatibacter sp.]